MRSTILILTVAVAGALSAGSLASTGTMHPTMGARLAGMGHHGVVNLHSYESTGRLCWKFQLNVMHVSGATIRDAHGMIVARLGHMYSAKGCAMVSKMALRKIESTPSSYRVWVATPGHPGELRGKLFAGMATM